MRNKAKQFRKAACYIEKIARRLPRGELYEQLKLQRKFIVEEDNELFVQIMKVLHRKYRNAFWRGRGRAGNKAIARERYVYKELQNIFDFSSEGETIRIKDLVYPTPRGYEEYIFAQEFVDVVLHYLVGLENIKKFSIFQVEGSYELPNMVKVERGDVVIDCGANLGLYSAVASKEGAIVYAFEPLKRTIEKYLQVTAENNPNIEVVNMALSDKIGETEFIVDEINLGHSRIKDNEKEKTEIVRMITIDEFVRARGLDRVDFIKADIEGAERYMLAGAVETLKKYAPKLAICTYHLPDDPEVLENIITKANPNYKVYHGPKKLYAYAERKGMR